jgi:hypothetical protein
MDLVPINDSITGEQLYEISLVKNKSPWYADIVNFLVCDILPQSATKQQKKKFRNEAKHYFWDEPHLYKHCANGILRRCLLEDEVWSVIYHCHASSYGGHASTAKTQAKVLQVGFY